MAFKHRVHVKRSLYDIIYCRYTCCRQAPYQTFEVKTDATNGGDTVKPCLQYILAFHSRDAAGGHYVFVADAGHSSVLVLNTDTGVYGSIGFPERAAATGAGRDIMFMVILRKANGRAGLYTTFLSGCRVFTVDLEHIDRYAEARPAVAVVGRKPFRMTVLGSDTGSRMFFRRPAENEIWTWDANCPFHDAAFRLVSKGTDCRAPVQVVPGYDGIVFVLRNNFDDYVRNSTGSLGAYTIVQPVSVLPSFNCSRTTAAPATTATSTSTAATSETTLHQTTDDGDGSGASSSCECHNTKD